MASEVRKRASGLTETYVAYGSTERLYKSCAAQADYTVPNAADRAVELPKTKDGVDRGVGSGWWYSGMSIVALPNTLWEQRTEHSNTVSQRQRPAST